MSARKSEEDLSGLLHALAQSASAERPSPGMEAILLDEFRRRRSVVAPVARHQAAPRSPRPFRSHSGGWLAVAASVVLVVAAAAGWRSLVRPGADVSRANTPGGGPAILAAEALPPVVAAPVAVRTARPAPLGNGQAKVGRKATAPPHGGEPIEFVAWPGAAALPTLESGQVLRLELPAGVIPLLGLPGEVRAGRAMVPADVIVGQDGRPRAVRLVSDER